MFFERFYFGFYGVGGEFSEFEGVLWGRERVSGIRYGYSGWRKRESFWRFVEKLGDLGFRFRFEFVCVVLER